MQLPVIGGSGLVEWRIVKEAAKFVDQFTYTFYNHGVDHPSADAKELDPLSS